MRCALLLSGMIRNFKDTFPSLNHYIIEKYNPDIFIYGVENKSGKEKNIEDIRELYDPKKFIINESSFYDSIPTNGMKSIYYHSFNLLECNKLKEEWKSENDLEDYDVVIWMRLDAFWKRSFTDEEIELTKDNILTSKEYSFKMVNPIAVSDMMMVCSDLIFNKASNLFNRLGEYKNEISFHPETIFGYNLNKIEANVIEIPSPFHYEYPTPALERKYVDVEISKYYQYIDLEGYCKDICSEHPNIIWSKDKESTHCRCLRETSSIRKNSY